MFVTPGRYVSHQTRYVSVPTIIVMFVKGQRVHWRWEDESKRRKSTLSWVKVAMKSGKYHKEERLKNRGLIGRAYRALGALYRFTEEDEARLQDCLQRAKQELGDRQRVRHDKWTSRVVQRAVNLFVDEGLGDDYE